MFPLTDEENVQQNISKQQINSEKNMKDEEPEPFKKMSSTLQIFCPDVFMKKKS